MTDTSDNLAGESPKRSKSQKPRSVYADAAYDVGKGKPPAKNQFKPGGKPGPGRPKGSRNRSDLDKVLDELIPVGEDRLGRLIRKSGRRLANIQLRNKAVQGDLRAIDMIRRHERAMAAIKARGGEAPLTAEEQLANLREEDKKDRLSAKLSGEMRSMLTLTADLRKLDFLQYVDGQPHWTPRFKELQRRINSGEVRLPLDPSEGGEHET